ncbi:MAG TPA: G1 family glutamic endopeptidase [Chloroflexota bacterium]|nr:G1 family glutamic endopeptidase [Chloroflexota bacterium]
MDLNYSNRYQTLRSRLQARPRKPATRLVAIAALALLIVMSLAACDPTALTGLPIESISPNSTVPSAPGSSGGSGAQTAPSAPSTAPSFGGAPSQSAPSTDATAAIKAVIEKANQEEVQAFASQNPSVMADTATSTYYQQMAQQYNSMSNSGITAIQLLNLTWGNITQQDANTAQANTTETWQTTYSDGSTTQDTNANVYTLVLQNGSWKIQDDQQPNSRNQQPGSGNQGNPTIPTNPGNPGTQGSGTPPFRGRPGVTPTPVVPTAPDSTNPFGNVPSPSGPTSSAPSADTTAAIKAVIEKGNQEEVQAFASQNPSLMADTATSTYYQAMVQNYNSMANAGVQSIQLLNLTWGNISLQDANTAQASTTETWQTTYSDGSTTQDTNANVYTLVLQNGSWKIQDDQQPNTHTLQPQPGNQGNPNTTPSIPSAPTPSGPSSSAPSGNTTAAIKAVIEKGNQEEVQAFASQNPSLMADTATSTYYQQMVQNYNSMANSGVQSIQLLNLTWGNITQQDANTAQANTTETWQTTYSDGSTTQDTNANVYTLVLQNGSWKIQDDQQPQSGNQGNPTSPTIPNNPGNPGTGGVAPVPPSTSVGQSSNWAGYAATGGTFTAVSGNWTVPNVSAGSGSTMSADATWVGIGGVNTTDLIQAGTQAIVQGGQVEYSAWWETLPQTPVTVPLDVNPGDNINVSITQQSSGTWLVVIHNLTTAQSFQKTVTYRSSLSSAEWVEEAPTAARGTLPLDAFGTVNFTQGVALENGQQVTIKQANGQPISMYGSSGIGRRGLYGQPSGRSGGPLAQPSAIGADGSSFSVTRTNVALP